MDDIVETVHQSEETIWGEVARENEEEGYVGTEETATSLFCCWLIFRTGVIFPDWETACLHFGCEQMLYYFELFSKEIICQI